MKKLTFLTAAAAAMALAACTDSDDLSALNSPQLNGAQTADNVVSFSTNVGKNRITRAGATGSIGTDTLKGKKWNDVSVKWSETNAKAYGFGVFAYYTGKNNYASEATEAKTDGTTVGNTVANFMFNQLVWWNDNLGDDYITKWTYDPLKYWPNEVNGHYTWTKIAISSTGTGAPTASGSESEGDLYYDTSGKKVYKYTTEWTAVTTNEAAVAPTTETAGTQGDFLVVGSDYYQLTAIDGVDDQVDDKDNDNATTTYTNGGNVSFFAYAPYVGLSATDWTDVQKNDGIIAINGGTTLSATNNKQQDPILTYLIPTEGNKMVDLLWGTMGVTSKNVNNAGNVGVTGAETGDNYTQSVLKGYTVNANLTKQTTGGTIGFAFKHALAKVGGSTTVTPGGGDDVKNGLMVVLDLDDLKGAEVGGSKEDATRVTITDIKIEARTLVADESGSQTIGETKVSYMKKAQGNLNLATGQWEVLKDLNAEDANTTDNLSNDQSEAATTTHNIVTKVKGISKLTASAYLADAIGETVNPTTAGNATNWSAISGKTGVITTPQNVYEYETNPLVFIPNTYPELTFTIRYTVRTKDDAHLANYYSEVSQVICKKLTFQEVVQLNKQYSILMHLGLTGVKFTAEVSNWELDDDSKNFDSDNDGTVDIEVKNVYLPINVSGLIAKAPEGLASTATTFDMTTLKYYTYDTDGITSKEVDVLATTDGLSYEKISGDEIINMTTTNNAKSKAVTISANTTFADKTETFKVTYTKDGATYTSEPITITQYGRILEEVALTWGATPGDITYNTEETSYTSVSAKTVADKAWEATAAGEKGSTIAGETAISDAFDLVFIDKATNNEATWISNNATDKKIKTKTNDTSVDREAEVWIRINGKLVKSDQTIKQTKKS